MVRRQGKPRHVSPSRARYEQSHPTVSLRVDLDTRKELLELKEKAGSSVADVLRFGLKQSAPSVREAYYRGFVAALAEMYEITCDECEDLALALCPDPP